MARTAVNSSATHVFEVLRLIARTDEPLGVSEISRRLALPASTVYRALITLEESDYIVRYQNMPRYELGPMPQLLNRALVHRFALHAASRPHLRAIAERTGDTATLTVRLGWYGLRLAGVYGSHDIYHRDRLGEVLPLHRGAARLSMLASLDSDEAERFRRFAQRQDFAVDWKTVGAAMTAARADGIARDALGAALPVRNPDGDVLAAIGITAAEPKRADERAWREARDALEAEIAAAPASFVSPFAHIPADEIVISLDRVA